jgi:hypothetical protein
VVRIDYVNCREATVLIRPTPAEAHLLDIKIDQRSDSDQHNLSMIVQTRSKPAEVFRLKFSDGLSLEETPLDVALQISKLVVNRFAERSMLI